MTAEIESDVEVFRDLRSVLVESIFWDDRTGEVVWVDITAGTLHRGRLDGAVDGSDDRVVALPAPVSAVQPAADGGYVAALKDRVVLLGADGELRDELARVEHAHDGIRFNEGKVDPYGRFVVGAMDVTVGDPDAGLYLVDEQGRIDILRGGFGVANGFEWTDDGSEMFVTDTSTSTVYRAPYRDGAQPLGELRPFLVGHASDGLVRDTDGRFWNGVYGGGEVLCWSPEGDVIARVPMPAPNVTSVAFAGPERKDLLVGTARENLTEADLVDSPRSGSILRIRTTATGRPVHTFGRRHDPSSTAHH
ncbi:SMP-30/gluconolactonase/LRE family protein [Microbacterium xanthum]|uniref:SMP-30/gluconolactonase/LRE family protein n=1 Tax=Microbacterium xanthum TaxID=3079794 RepID=UPI002AD3AF00|nr:SMP-30/gluconolactonase/LRE family protein [Microbacterium sp. KSW-48]MDZ8170794.1 SMP-30/gluconolactonase/LRE family protein [Microbacterium sp. KSW-48]